MTKIAAGHGIIGVETQRGFETGSRLFDSAAAAIEIAQIAVGLVVGGIELGHSQEFLLCRLPFLQHQIEQGKFVVRLIVLRLDPDGRQQMFLGLGQFAHHAQGPTQPGVRRHILRIALLHAAVMGGARVVELPVQFVDRTVGESKLGTKDIIEFFRSAAWIRFQSSKVFIKFCITGASGVLINLGVFSALLSLGLNKFVASPIAIQCSIITNFVGNNYWTFRRRNLVGPVHARGLRFNVVSILSLAISYLTFVLLSHVFPGVAPQVNQFGGIVPATLVNYFLNSYWTFRNESRATGR